MSYKIINFDENVGLITVKFDNSVNPVSISLPIDNSHYLTGSELDLFINGFNPVVIQRDCSGVKNIEEIKSLVAQPEEIILSPGELAIKIRSQRNLLLAATDYTQLKDCNLPIDVAQQFTDYRQKLRDITEQKSFPMSVVWPENNAFATPVVTLGIASANTV